MIIMINFHSICICIGLCCSHLPEENTPSFIQSAKNVLQGMFDKCASCAASWERVVCALTCSPKQGIK